MALGNLAERILLAPAKNGSNRLCILTKIAAPNMASWLLRNYSQKPKKSVKVEIVISDIATDGISLPIHEGFKKLQTDISNFNCNYAFESVSVDSNLYIWLSDDTPVSAFSTDVNFEQSVFLEGSDVDAVSCDASGAFEQYKIAESKSIYCNHIEIEDTVRIYHSSSLGNFTNADEGYLGDCRNEVILSLVTKRTGEPGTRSGLNWGQRKGRNKNQAYIPLPIEIAKSGFFPTEPKKAPPHFTVVTDDKRQLILRLEQQNHKAITTPLSNAQLGEYFRGRLNLANGAYVTRADLERYGRIDVRFVKIDEEHYYLDFSV